MRYCGNCGAELDAAAISSGTCPTCGMALDPSTISAGPAAAPPVTGDLQQTVLDVGNVASAGPWGPTVPLEMRLAPNEPMALANARPNTARMARVTANQPMKPLSVIALGIGIGVALLLVLVLTLSLISLGAHSGSSSAIAAHPSKTLTIGPTATDAGLGFATQAPNPTPLPYTAPSPVATDTPYGGIPTATTGPAPTQPDAPTATPSNSGQATLVLSAPTCNATGQGQFTIAAQGNGSLDWQATADKPALISPQNGTVAGGQAGQPVNVASGSPVRVTIVANPGNQSQSVKINCVP